MKPPDGGHQYRSNKHIFTGYVLPDGRRGGKCWGERPRCINAHRLVSREPILSEGIVTCQHREHRAGALVCGVRLYVMRYFPASHPEEIGWELVEITHEHIARMQREPMLHFERMIILGLALHGVELDIPEQEIA